MVHSISHFSNIKTEQTHVEELLSVFEDESNTKNDAKNLKQLKAIDIIQHQTVDCSNSKNTQLCVVCGDIASGFHYDVSSCNGCKTFFRRTIVSGRKFVCQKGGNCKFDKNKRCACRACRFQQCLANGMNVQAIQYIPSINFTLSIVRKRFQCSFQQKQSKVSKKRQKLKEYESDIELNTSITKHIWNVQDEMLKYIGETLRIEEMHNRLRCSNFYPYEKDLSIADVLGKSISFKDVDKYKYCEKWPVDRKPQVIWPNAPYGAKFWLYLDLYLSLDHLKTFHFFPQMTMEEKIAFAKVTALPNSILTSAYYSYTQRAEECIIYPDDTMPFCFRTDSLTGIEREVRKGLLREMHRLRPDQIQFGLFRIITFLNNDCEQLSETTREMIATMRFKYTKILFYYLQNKHGIEEGVRKFTETLMFSSSLSRFTRLRYSYFAYRLYVMRSCCPSIMFRECMNDM